MPPAIPPYIELSVLLDRRLPPAAGLGEEEADLVLGEDGGEFVGGVVGARAGASVPRAAVAAVEAAVLAIAAVGEFAEAVGARLRGRRLALGGATAVADAAPVLPGSPILLLAAVSGRCRVVLVHPRPPFFNLSGPVMPPPMSLAQKRHRSESVY